MFSFDDLAAVAAALDRLAARPEPTAPDTESTTPRDPNATGPLVALLPRQPGSREARYAHLLGGPVASADLQPELAAAAPVGRIGEVEAQLAALQAQLQTLADRVAALEEHAGARTQSSSLPTQFS